MIEFKNRRVKHLPRDKRKIFVGRAVHVIAQYRMSETGQLNTDLMRAAGERMKLNKTGDGPDSLLHQKFRTGPSTGSGHREALAFHRMSRDAAFQRALIGL